MPARTTWIPFNLLLTLTCLILAFAISTRAQARPDDACKNLQTIIEEQQQHLTELDDTTPQLEALLEGRIADNLDLTRLLGTALDVESEVRNAGQLLESNASTTQPRPALADAFQGCDNNKQWLQLSKRIDAAELNQNQLKQRILLAPRAQRLALVRGTNQWLAIAITESRIQSWSTENEQQQLASAELLQWIEIWRSAVRAWLPALMQDNVSRDMLDQHWETCLAIPDPGATINWKTLDGSTSVNPSPLEWLETLEEARTALRVESSKWRNNEIRAGGWEAFVEELMHPAEFGHQLSAELRIAPRNLVDSVSRPFVRDYRRALHADKLGELLSSWFMQSLGLAGIFWLLTHVASLMPGYLSNIQGRLMQRITHRVLNQFTAGIFWLFKPNAAWIVVLAGSTVSTLLISDDWYILRWTGPLGILYGAFRAVHVILEWMVSRSFTRSGQFVSSQTAAQQTEDVRRTAWILVVNWLSWWLVRATGGGYSIFIITLINIAVSWWAFLWLLNRYPNQFARFLLYSVGKPAKNEQDIAVPLHWWIRILWPGLFVLAHLIDVVLSCHQKLLFLDGYRAFSVKLLRMRLEVKEDDREAEVDETELPDQSYGEWILREPKKTDPWIEVCRIEALTGQIQKWHGEKTEENVQLVIGDQGSGKTALVNRLATEWTSTPVKYIEIPPKCLEPAAVFELLSEALALPDCTSISALVALDATLEPHVVVVDSAHNLFLTEVGKLDAYRTFIQCLNAHLSNVYWVVVMHAPSWTYLNCVFSREQRFSNIFRMPKWAPADIRKLILSRHQGSRRRLRYDEMLLSASAGSESSSIRAADSRVFNIIWDQCGGNPQVALYLWLTAARSKDRSVEVGVPQKPAAAILNSLKDDLSFVYAAVIQHKSLTTAEIVEATNFPEPIVRHAIKQGLNLGILHRDYTRRYTVHPLWQSALTSHLIRTNMLWNM